MIIRVSEIPDDGVAIEGVAHFSQPFADASWSLLGLSLFVQREDGDVLVRGNLRVQIPQTCGRCLEPFAFEFTARVETRFCPDRRARNEEVELAPDDLEVDFYANDVLDLNRLIQTETELALVMKPLCREDCRGLCPVCGGNRNVVSCSCEVRAPDPRLAALKALADRLSSR